MTKGETILYSIAAAAAIVVLVDLIIFLSVVIAAE